MWSANGDSIYYSAEGFDPQPGEPRVILGLPHTGGAAARILRNVDDLARPELPLWLTAPDLATDGERLAYVQIANGWPDRPCIGDLGCTPGIEEIPFPTIRQVIYRVRHLEAVGPPVDDPSVLVTMPDVVVGDTTIIIAGVPIVVPTYDVRFASAPRRFADGGPLYFRPRWDPDGERIVFSDGAGLWLWTVGEPGVAPIPNTAAGGSPAWSPDGEWIAYARVESGDSTRFSCVIVALFGPCAFIEYELHTPGVRTLGLVRPDGSELRDLGPGEDPAWSPDAAWLYFQRDGAIWRMGPDGGDAAALPGTEDGREPAISPDGDRLAFARRTTRGDHDLWVLELEP